MDGERQFSCARDYEHVDYTTFVQAHLNSYFLPLARRYVGSQNLDSAPDVASEALGCAWSKWPELGWEPCGRKCAFVCATMSNFAHMERRKRRRLGKLTDPAQLPDRVAPEAGPEARFLAGEEVRTVERALAALRPQERLIIDLAIAKLPHSEIARQLGITTTNVSTRLLRARIRLARYLDPNRVADVGLRFGTDPSGGVA